MSENENNESPRISDDISKFDSWFDTAIKLPGIDVDKHDHLKRMKENMRMAWRECAKVKNKEYEELQKALIKSKKEIESFDDERKKMIEEMQRLTSRAITAEKAARK
jgi:hypothetical protein